MPGAAAREALVALSAALATRDRETIRAAMQRAMVDAEPRAVEEVLLQAHLFLGFPDALEALTLWRELSGTTPAPAAQDEAEWQARGERVCHTVYAANYEKLRANVAALSPDLDDWMVRGGYGRVIGRAGLDLATRELCIAALLAVWNAPRQLHSHLRGARNAGASIAEVDRAIEIACSFIAPGEAARVRALWADVRARAAARARPAAEMR
jgi:4-carboxymuconolactone decarboxylase